MTTSPNMIDRNILIEMYQFALELSETEIPKLYELGHYLTDNLISKICLVVAKESDTNFRQEDYEQKSFPQLYEDTIETYYPNTLKYIDISDLHSKRNIYQHKYWSIEYHFNRQYSLDYIEKVKEIMISIGIINANDSIEPTDYLNKGDNTLVEAVRRVSHSTIPIPDSFDDLKDILRKYLKNLIIVYYRNVLDEKKDLDINKMIKKVINKLIELNDPSANSFLDGNGSIKHQDIVQEYFGINVSQFKEKLKTNEISIEEIKRSLQVAAGDLAFEFKNEYEPSLSKKHNFVKDIRGKFAVNIGSYDFIRESYDAQRFKNALNILEKEFELIELIGPDFEGSESITKWKILSQPRLEELVKKKSINYILKDLV